MDNCEKENIDPRGLSAGHFTLHDTSLFPDFALAFDIDGVLLRGKIPFSNSVDALELLRKNNVSFIMLTNSGGHPEDVHSKRVSDRLGTEIKEDQFVQSHTPFKSVIGGYRGQWVLVLGGSKHQIKELAATYGLDRDRILTTSDVQQHHPGINPFPELTHAHHSTYGEIRDSFTDKDRIAAVFVFSSPRDWCLDVQVSLDLLLSEGGVLGTRSAKNGDESLPNCGYQQDGQPVFYFCNPDFEWATQYCLPRLAQGGFRAALEGVWQAATKGRAELQAWTCGKPTSTTYRYAERVLEENHHRLALSTRHGNACNRLQQHHQYRHHGTSRPLRKVYMIGDNLKSDICGALLADKESHLEWRSVLVETGVYEAGTIPEHQPTVIKENVLEAVKWILHQEMGSKVDF